MYSPLQMLVKRARYWLTAANGKGHGIHSPFVFQFVINVLNDDRFFYAFENIEDNVNADTNNTKYNRLLFKIIHYFQQKNILLIDESIGITTSYIALANVESAVTSYHSQADTITAVAQTTAHLSIKNIVFSNDKNSLQTKPLDVVFINPKSAALLTEQLDKILPHLHEQSILIINNIHASKPLEKAWNNLQSNTAVTLTINLFQFGLVFFRPENKIAQHFTIRF